MVPFIYLVIFFLGALLGFWIAHIMKTMPIGTLRVDRSDPDGTYLFLELHPGGIEEIQRSKRVVLEVNMKSYLSQE